MRPRTQRPGQEYAALRRSLAQTDPELLEAVDEVDRELLRWMKQLSPLERLRVASRASRALASFRRAPS